MLVLDPVPLVLEEEGWYALSDIKKIEVTRQFIGLGERVTQCGTTEFRVDCLSKKYLEKVLSTCGCAPLSLKSYAEHEVSIKEHFISTDFMTFWTEDLFPGRARLREGGRCFRRGVSREV